jgi:hypothetical protein
MILTNADADVTDIELDEKLHRVLTSDPIFLKMVKSVVDTCRYSPEVSVIQAIKEAMPAH